METPSGGDQVAGEDKGLAGRSDVAGAPVPVGQIRGDDQLAAAEPDRHAKPYGHN
jgi:hypothetical protein